VKQATRKPRVLITRIALYKGPEQPGDVARILELLSSMVHAAVGRGARPLIHSELSLTDYNIGATAGHRLVEPAGGPAVRQAARRPSRGRR
jgi:hypothetical protein